MNEDNLILGPGGRVDPKAAKRVERSLLDAITVEGGPGNWIAPLHKCRDCGASLNWREYRDDGGGIQADCSCGISYARAFRARPVPGGEGEVEERAAFEKWAKSKGCDLKTHDVTFKRPPWYAYDDTRHRWAAWQARAALRREASGAGVPVAWLVENDVNFRYVTTSENDAAIYRGDPKYRVVPLYPAPFVGEASGGGIDG